MTNGPIWEVEKGVMIRVVVKPKSKDQKLISEVTADAVYVNLTGQAREGKANLELLKRVSKLLKISTADITIVAGHKSREKTLLIIGKSAKDVEKSFTR